MTTLAPAMSPLSRVDTARVPDLRIQPLAVAVAGAGFITAYHLAILRELGGFEIVGACDPDLNRLNALCKQWNIPNAAATVPELLSKCRPAIMHVLTPPAFHVAVAEQALQGGVHVLVEKPLALNVADCERLLALAQERGLVLGVNHNAVFHPIFQRLRRDVAGRKLGKVEHAVSVQNLPLAQLDSGEHDHWMFREPGNILFEQAPHPLAQIVDLVGAVREVQTLRSGERVLRNGRVFSTCWQMSFRCEHGTAQLFLSFGRSFPESRVQVVGQDAVADLDLMNGTYALDRRTKYLEPVDRLLRGWRWARQVAGQAMGGFWRYGLSVLKLGGRSDAFYLGMRDSLAAFYRAARGEDSSWDSAKNGVQVIDGLERAAAAMQPPVRYEPSSVSATRVTATPKTGDILVIGGTGFIGRRVVRALMRAGHPVRLLARRPGAVTEVEGGKPAIVQGDVRQAEDVARAVAGCKAVIHLVAGAPDSWVDFEKLFIDGTRHTAEACLQHGVEHLLFVSSIAALYLGSANSTITEETPVDDRPDKRSPYTRVKVVCEKLLVDMHRDRGLPVSIYRPGVVVGTGGPVEHQGVGWWPTPAHCISWGRKTRSPLPFVLVDDVANALVAALGKRDVMGRCFNLVGDVRLSAEEYLDALRTASGRDIVLHRQSIAWWQAVDVFKWAIKFVARKADNAFPSLRDLRSRALRSPFDCRVAKATLGWQPTADREVFIEQGVRVPMRERGDG